MSVILEAVLDLFSSGGEALPRPKAWQYTLAAFLCILLIASLFWAGAKP